MTNLKPERLSMKRRHRFSGNNPSTYDNFCSAIYAKQTFDTTPKGQVISKEILVPKIFQKTNEILVRISALASKMG